MEQEFRSRSLWGAKEEEIRNWVASYIHQAGLRASVEELIQLCLTVEGTHKGVTKTKVRKARSLLLSRLAA